MRRRNRKSPRTRAGAASRPATITARTSWLVRPAPPPASGTAHASSRGTSCNRACTRSGRPRNSPGSIRIVERAPFCALHHHPGLDDTEALHAAAWPLEHETVSTLLLTDRPSPRKGSSRVGLGIREEAVDSVGIKVKHLRPRDF